MRSLGTTNTIGSYSKQNSTGSCGALLYNLWEWKHFYKCTWISIKGFVKAKRQMIFPSSISVNYWQLLTIVSPSSTTNLTKVHVVIMKHSPFSLYVCIIRIKGKPASKNAVNNSPEIYGRFFQVLRSPVVV